MENLTADVWADPGARLGEGPLWISPDLWSVDILEGNLYRIPCRPDGSAGDPVTYHLGESIGSAAPCVHGGLAAALKNSIVVFNPENGSIKTIFEIQDANPKLRFNDGKCDPDGRFLVGTMHQESMPFLGSLYSLDTDLSMRTLLNNVSISNGLAWSSSGSTLYYVDTPTLKVQAFDYSLVDGAISNPETIIEIPEGMGLPDGMTIDTNGNLWIALWNGGGVGCWDPCDGKLLSFIKVPVLNVTSCTFGGVDMRTLFITTARDGVSPYGGMVFSCRPGACGTSPHLFKGYIQGIG